MSQNHKRKSVPKKATKATKSATANRNATREETKRRKRAATARKKYAETKEKKQSKRNGAASTTKQDSKRPKRTMTLLLSKYAKENFDNFQAFQLRLRKMWTLYPIVDPRY